MKHQGHKIFYYISMVGIGLAILGLLYIGFMLFYPYKTMQFSQAGNLKILNENKNVRAGEELQYEVSYCRYTDKQAIVTRTIQDGIVYILPELQTNTGKGCKENAKIAIAQIPKAIPTGKYTMLITIQFRVNPLRTITHTLATEPFNVVK